MAFTKEDYDRMESSGLMTKETADKYRDQIKISSIPISDTPMINNEPPNRELQGFENFEYGLAKIAEPVISPLMGMANKEGFEKYDNSVRDKIIANRMNPEQQQAASLNGNSPIKQEAPPVVESATPAEIPPQNETYGTPGNQAPTNNNPNSGFQSQGGKFERQIDKNVADTNKQMDTLLQRQEAIDKRFNEKWDKLDIESNKLANEPFKDYWADATTGDKITAGVAILAGAIGNALMGGKPNENAALDIIKNAVVQDMDKQKAEYTKKNNAFARAMDITKNEHDAEVVFINAAMEQAVKKAKVFDDGMKSKIMIDKMGQIAQNLNAKPIKSSFVEMRQEKNNLDRIDDFQNVTKYSTEQHLKKLRQSLDILRDPKKDVSGIISQIMPESFNQDRSFVMNSVYEAAASGLKGVYGPNPTDSDRDILNKFSFGRGDKDSLNLLRVEALYNTIKNKYDNMNNMSQYLYDHGNTVGYRPQHKVSAEDIINKKSIGQTPKKNGK